MAVDELARAIALRLTPSNPDATPAVAPSAKSVGTTDRTGRSAQ
jgi:hypothetical protein